MYSPCIRAADKSLSPAESKPSLPTTKIMASQTLAASKTPIKSDLKRKKNLFVIIKTIDWSRWQCYLSGATKANRFLNLGKARWTVPVAEVVTTDVSSHAVRASTTVRDVTSLSLDRGRTATRMGGDLKLPGNSISKEEGHDFDPLLPFRNSTMFLTQVPFGVQDGRLLDVPDLFGLVASLFPALQGLEPLAHLVFETHPATVDIVNRPLGLVAECRVTLVALLEQTAPVMHCATSFSV